MRLRNILGAGAVSCMALATAAASAQAAPGVVVEGINLRAGPGTDYPWLASLAPGTPAEIYGCLDGWSWCDISADGIRGWAAGVGLQVEYDDQPGPLASYGPEIGLPFIGFAFGDYWGRYYRDRPFYSPVDRWHGGPGPGGGPGGGYGGPGRGPGNAPGAGFQGGAPRDDRDRGDPRRAPGQMQNPEQQMRAGQPAERQGGGMRQAMPFERPGGQAQMGGDPNRGPRDGGARPGPAGAPRGEPAGARPGPGRDQGRPGGPG